MTGTGATSFTTNPNLVPSAFYALLGDFTLETQECVVYLPPLIPYPNIVINFNVYYTVNTNSPALLTINITRGNNTISTFRNIYINTPNGISGHQLSASYCMKDELDVVLGQYGQTYSVRCISDVGGNFSITAYDFIVQYNYQ